MNHSQPPPTMHNLNLRLSTTNVVQPKPTINFRPKTAFVRCSQRFETRNRWKMHTAYNTALADRTTHRTTPVSNSHQSSALHVPFRQRRITTPMSGLTPVPGLAQRPSPPSASTDRALLRPPRLPSEQTSAGCFYARANSGMPGAEMAISSAARSTVVKSARLACQQGTISPAISFFGGQIGKMHRQIPSNLQFAHSGCAGNIIAMRHLFPQN